MKLLVNEDYEKYCCLEVRELMAAFPYTSYIHLKTHLERQVEFLLDEETFDITPVYNSKVEEILKKYSITIQEFRKKFTIDMLMLYGNIDTINKITTCSNRTIYFQYDIFKTRQNAEGIVQLTHNYKKSDFDSEFDGINTDDQKELYLKSYSGSIKSSSTKKEENDKYIKCITSFGSYRYSSSTGFLFHHLYKKKTISTYFWKDSYKISKFIGKTRVYTFNNLDHHIFIEVERYLASNNAKYLKTYQLLKNNYQDAAKFLANPMWRDLNYSLIGSIDKNTAARFTYHYKKYGTKKLREVFFQTKNKAIQQFLIENPIQNLLTLSFVIQKYVKDNNHVLSLLTRFSKERGLSRFSNSLYISHDDQYEEVFKLLIQELKISPRKIINMKIDFLTISDVSRMYSQIKTYNPNYIFPDKEDISRAHDLLSRDLRDYRNKKANRVITLTELEENYKKELDNYIIEPVTQTEELSRIGSTMNICVGSYDSKAVDKRCTIVGLYSKENKEPIVCIEVSQNKIIQAKLKRNSRVSSDPVLKEYVINWAEENNLGFDTYDIEDSKSTSW